MTTRNLFDCNICDDTSIKDGITLPFSHTMNDRGPRYALGKAVEGLHVFPDYPKVLHVCSKCKNLIENPTTMEKIKAEKNPILNPKNLVQD